MVLITNVFRVERKKEVGDWAQRFGSTTIYGTKPMFRL